MNTCVFPMKRSNDGYWLRKAEIRPEDPSRFDIRASELVREKERAPFLRPRYDRRDGLRVLICLPSEKPTKNKPLYDWLTERINTDIHHREVFYETFTYSVTNTGVGEQPLHTENFHGGKKGAVQRIRHGVKLIEDMVSDYHAVFFLAVESDIDVREEPFYDRANIILFEYHTRYTAGVMSRGPTVQPELFRLADRDITYGQVLAKKFEGVQHDDWHKFVCQDQRQLNCRSAFISDALDRLIKPSMMENIFSFCIYA